MNKNIIEIKNELKQVEIILTKQIEEIKNQRHKLEEICNHDIILKFHDNRPHKIGPITLYICPICDKVKKIYVDNKIEESEFSKSKIIDLKELDYLDALRSYNSICNYILENYEDFYEQNIDVNELKESIYEYIKEQEINNNPDLRASFYYNINNSKKSKKYMYDTYKSKRK